MFLTIKRFAQNDDGAVTVDWVVLTAAIVGLAIAIIGTVSKGALDQSAGIGANIAAKTSLVP